MLLFPLGNVPPNGLLNSTTNDSMLLCTQKNETQPESDTNICKNVGGEASTYLKHIVQNYETLTEKTVFLHDEEFSWHHNGSIIDVVNNSMSYDFCNLNHYKMNTILNNPVLPLIINCFYKPYLRPYIGDLQSTGIGTLAARDVLSL